MPLGPLLGLASLPSGSAISTSSGYSLTDNEPCYCIGKLPVGVTAVAFVFNACASFIFGSEFGQQDRKPFLTKCILKTWNVPLTRRLRSALR